MSALYLLRAGDEYRTSPIAEVGCEVVAMVPARVRDEAQRTALRTFFDACLAVPEVVAMAALSVRYEPLALEYGLSLWPPERRLTSASALSKELVPQMQAHRARRKPFPRQQALVLRECEERVIRRYLGLLAENEPLMRVKMAIEHLEAVPSHPMVHRPCLTEVDILVSLRLEPPLERYQLGSRVYEGKDFQDLVQPYTLATQFGCPYASASKALKWLHNATHGRCSKKPLALIGGQALAPLIRELAPGAAFSDVPSADAYVITVQWAAPPRWLEYYLRS